MIFIVNPATNILSEKESGALTPMVSQILRHVTLAVTRAQENETEIAATCFLASCGQEAAERKQADFDSVREELPGSFLGSGHTQRSILGLGPAGQSRDWSQD